MSTRRHLLARDGPHSAEARDRGASLVMAIGFVVLIGSIAAGLSALVTSSLNNRLTLADARDRQYAADGAIEEAIAEVRMLDRTTSGACGAAAGNRTSTLNGYTIRVDWQNVCGVVRTAAGELVAQRNVVFDACVDGGATCRGQNVILRAQVNFEQGSTGAVTRTYVQSWNAPQATSSTNGCPTVVNGWRGEYFASTDLSGEPVLCRDDPAIAFSWDVGAPDPSVPADRFSVRWTRSLDLAAGMYGFATTVDDGVRLYVNGVLVIDRWTVSSATTNSALVDLPAGRHAVVMEVFEELGGATATLTWQQVNPTCGPVAPGTWRMQISDGMNLGQIVECRNVATIDVDWGGGGPNAFVGNDTFSVRWSRTLNLPAGRYRFTAGSDDGVRVYVNGALVIDRWVVRPFSTDSVDLTLAAGDHEVVMEYYEQFGGARASLGWAMLP